MRLPRTIRVSVHADDICVWTSRVTCVQLTERLQTSYHYNVELSSRTRPRSYDLKIARHNISMPMYEKISSYKWRRQDSICTITLTCCVTVDRGLMSTAHVNGFINKLISFALLIRFIRGTSWGNTVSFSPSPILSTVCECSGVQSPAPEWRPEINFEDVFKALWRELSGRVLVCHAQCQSLKLLTRDAPRSFATSDRLRRPSSISGGSTAQLVQL